MSDIVEAALSNQETKPGHGELNWHVTFVSNETRTGTIGFLGDSNYVLQKGDKVLFFNASKVVYLKPER
jgi:hypothetical protein